MSYKDVSSLDAEVTIALGKKDKQGKPYPKQAEGYYLGSRSVQNKRGESKLHFLQTQNGNLGIWGTTDLNRKLGQVGAGDKVRITSTGTKPTPNGDMYTYRVEVDDTDKIQVAAETASDDSYDEGSDDSYESNDSGADYDEAEMLTAAAEKAAIVKALLNGKSKKA